MYFPKPALNENDLAIIERGSTAAHAIEAGQYVSWHGKTGKANATIAIGDTLDDTMFDYDEDGLFNWLNNKLNGEPITITPASGFNLGYNYSKKIGNNMFLVFGISKASGYVGQESWTTVATVQGLGIERSVVVPAAPYGTNSSARMEIYPNGDIKFIVLSSTCNGGVVNVMLPANS